MSTTLPLILLPVSPTRYSPDHGPAPETRTREPIGSTFGSAAIVSFGTGGTPSAVLIPVLYANAVNLARSFRLIGCLSFGSAGDAFGAANRLTATSSID